MAVKSKVMHVLLKSVMSDSREEAVEDTKECRSTLMPECQTTLMGEDGLSIFHDRHGPRSYHKLQNFPFDD